MIAHILRHLLIKWCKAETSNNLQCLVSKEVKVNTCIHIYHICLILPVKRSKKNQTSVLKLKFYHWSLIFFFFFFFFSLIPCHGRSLLYWLLSNIHSCIGYSKSFQMFALSHGFLISRKLAARPLSLFACRSPHDHRSCLSLPSSS